MPSDGFPYPVFALAALVPWMFVSQSATQGAGSLVADSNLLAKVYFPRLVIPLAKTLSLLLDLVIALGVLVVWCVASTAPQPIDRPARRARPHPAGRGHGARASGPGSAR